jgi:uncharacterized protein (TIGR03067 family)
MLSILFSLFTIAAPVPQDAKKAEASKIDGVWRVKQRESRGNLVKTTNALIATYTLYINNGEYCFRTHTGTIAVDADKKTLDMKVTDGPYKDAICLGLFERTGDTLKVALPLNPQPNQERPAELKTGPQTSYYVFTFELDKTVTAEQAAAKIKEEKTRLTAGGQLVRPAAPNPFGGPGGPAAGGRGGPPVQLPVDRTQESLDKILEKLEKIEKRLDELEKKK